MLKNRDKVAKLWDEFAEDFCIAFWDFQPIPMKLFVIKIAEKFAEEEKNVAIAK